MEAAAHVETEFATSTEPPPRRKRQPRPLDPEARARLTRTVEPEFESDSPPEAEPEFIEPARSTEEVERDCASVARLVLLGFEWLRLRGQPEKAPETERAATMGKRIARALAPRLSPGAGRWVEWPALVCDFGADLVEQGLGERHAAALEQAKEKSA